ncbi:hypothetical protein [Aneurinibacillus terranovensis]|uniref:hypothetical protein n=1 Tax=Aneurinibacillus terranovensis TaxID=278991 RepID=UPI0012DCA00D
MEGIWDRGAMVQEYVGDCIQCGTKIYCHDGFIGGVVVEPGKMLCFSCQEKKETEKEAQA